MKIAQIKQLVSQHTGVSVRAMEDTSLHAQRVALARWYVFWLCRKQGIRESHIARYFPCDHSIVARGKRTLDERRRCDWDLVRFLDQLLAEIERRDAA